MFSFFVLGRNNVIRRSSNGGVWSVCPAGEVTWRERAFDEIPGVNYVYVLRCHESGAVRLRFGYGVVRVAVRLTPTF